MSSRLRARLAGPCPPELADRGKGHRPAPRAMEQLMPLVRQELPVALAPFRVAPEDRMGLVVVDEVNGFCTVGMGNLAPPAHDSQISAMVRRTDALARDMCARGLPVLLLLDTHEPDRPEPPYPPHCIRGTGEELLVPELEWLQRDPHATLMEKDCINGFVGGMRPDGSNAVSEWVAKHGVTVMLVVGICTDICVMDFVLTALSARNHRVLSPVRDIVVLGPACATYDLPRRAAQQLGRGATAAHPQELTHHIGLYCMYSRGAVLASEVVLPPLQAPST